MEWWVTGGVGFHVWGLGYEPSKWCWLRILSLQARIAFMRNISVHTRVHIVGDVSHTSYSQANETLH